MGFCSCRFDYRDPGFNTGFGYDVQMLGPDAIDDRLSRLNSGRDRANRQLDSINAQNARVLAGLHGPLNQVHCRRANESCNKDIDRPII